VFDPISSDPIEGEDPTDWKHMSISAQKRGRSEKAVSVRRRSWWRGRVCSQVIHSDCGKGSSG